MNIAGREISTDEAPYIIAEVSANHNGSIDQAKRLITLAASAGADAVKLQTYTADTLTIDCERPDFLIEDGLWRGRTLHELYTEAHTPWDWHGPLFEHAKNVGITIFSSPFDNSAVMLLEELDAPAYKVASFEIGDWQLLHYIAETGKPVIISTGMATEEEIGEALQIFDSYGNKDVAILHCVSSYPAPSSDYNLRTIYDMQERFAVPVGLSDHTLDNLTATASVALGACIIEKHFTEIRAGGGPDDSFSIEPEELASLCAATKTVHSALGLVDYSIKASEEASRKFRRSLYFVNDLPKGAVIRERDVRSIRPGYGTPPKHINEVLGAHVTRDISRDTPVTDNSFSKSIRN